MISSLEELTESLREYRREENPAKCETLMADGIRKEKSSISPGWLFYYLSICPTTCNVWITLYSSTSKLQQQSFGRLKNQQQHTRTAIWLFLCVVVRNCRQKENYEHFKLGLKGDENWKYKKLASAEIDHLGHFFFFFARVREKGKRGWGFILLLRPDLQKASISQ